MNDARKAFDRFDKPGASWIPLILFSLIGIVGTAACVHAVSRIGDEERIEVVGDGPMGVAQQNAAARNDP